MGELGLYLSFPLFRLVSGNLGRWVWACTLRVYKLFTKTGGVLGEEEILRWALRCNKLHSTICTVLLSEFVSRNTWLQHLEDIVLSCSIVSDSL